MPTIRKAHQSKDQTNRKYRVLSRMTMYWKMAKY